ncbi:MAG: hypothetical protein R3E04_03180 [Sphingobium sp.]
MLSRLDEPEHRALPLPVEWQVGGTSKTLAIELHRLAPIKDCCDNIGRQIGDAQQHTKIVAAIPLCPSKLSNGMFSGSFDCLTGPMCLYKELDQRLIALGVSLLIGRNGKASLPVATDDGRGNACPRIFIDQDWGGIFEPVGDELAEVFLPSPASVHITADHHPADVSA